MLIFYFLYLVFVICYILLDFAFNSGLIFMDSGNLGGPSNGGPSGSGGPSGGGPSGDPNSNLNNVVGGHNSNGQGDSEDEKAKKSVEALLKFDKDTSNAIIDKLNPIASGEKYSKHNMFHSSSGLTEDEKD
jgi:hypothetical protein